jgi:ferric-dicitrate binding protein FerR (iron transport regulator)
VPLVQDGENVVASFEEQSIFVSRRRAIGLAGSAALIGVARPAFAGRAVGHVTAVSGNGFAGDTPVRALRASESLQMGDKVWTEAASRASLALDLGAVVHMGPEAFLVLDRFVTEATGELTLDAGAIVFERGADEPEIDFQVLSTFAQIGLRGTRFFAGPNRGVFAVFVDHGSVSVTAGGQQVTLGAGDGVDIAAPGAPPSDVVRWQPPRIAEAFESVLA